MVALIKASTLVLASSNVTTASAFSRLTSALITPWTLVSDLCTEITQPPQVMPDTDSVTVWEAPQPDAGSIISIMHSAVLISFFMALFLVC